MNGLRLLQPVVARPGTPKVAWCPRSQRRQWSSSDRCTGNPSGALCLPCMIQGGEHIPRHVRDPGESPCLHGPIRVRRSVNGAQRAM